MKGTFEVTKASDGRFMLISRLPNHEIILTSQLYKSQESAAEGISSVKKGPFSINASRNWTGADGKPYVVLHAANQLVIGRTEMYASDEARRKGIASVMRNAPDAEIRDLSLQAQP